MLFVFTCWYLSFVGCLITNLWVVWWFGIWFGCLLLVNCLFFDCGIVALVVLFSCMVVCCLLLVVCGYC